MKTNEKMITDAVRLAYKNVVENGGKPFGAILVKDGEIIATGVNDVLETHDPTAHAEIQAIRKASEKLGTDDLSGMIMFASGHPCPMCLAAMHLCGITEIYYAASLEEAAEAGFGVSHIYTEVGLPNEKRKHPLKRISATQGTENPMSAWKNRDDS
ncbi:nucleoside deaminase [Limibacter armeniacum]|uniref:nucleoside deaminase n=1 Tax=Limibacter armeniacum TaxID=466084 RepID=UPI002FE53699